MTEQERIKEELKNVLSLEITDLQAEQLYTYYQMLVEKNKVMNLTRVTDFDDALKKHIVDSLSIIKTLDPAKAGIKKMIDLGSGAGFPGMPIKIVWPELDVTMIDSVGKKMNFINEVIAALGLTNVRAMHARAEEMAHDKQYRETFDLCTSRAVANLATLSEYCLPFVKVGGKFIAYKSGESQEEIETGIKAIHVMGGKTPELLDFDLYDMKRTLVTVVKAKNTTKTYPRKAGTPSKSPIV